MAHLIDKDALIAEIDRQKIGYNVDGKHSVEYDIVRKIIDIINTLEVKEVNLNEEIERFVKSEEFQKASGTIRVTDLLTKHFFELGLKAQKGE